MLAMYQAFTRALGAVAIAAVLSLEHVPDEFSPCGCCVARRGGFRVSVGVDARIG